jgi:cytochrome c
VRFPRVLLLRSLSFIGINNGGMTLNFRRFMITGILTVLLLFSAGCMQAPPAQTPAPLTAGTASVTTSPVITPTPLKNATKEEMVTFVQEAVAYAHQNGKDKALAEFSCRNGSFFRGVLYIYAYDYNGTTIAHPVNPEKIGVNCLNEKDAEGNLFITDLRHAAYNGTGFITYAYINPVHNNIVEKKLGYVMKVDDCWWLGSGIYIGPAQTSAPVTTTQPLP